MASTYPHTHALLAAWNAQINTVSWEVRLEWVTAYLSRREIWPPSHQFPSLHERQARSQKCLYCPLNFGRKNITTWSFYLFQTVVAVFVQQACHSLSHGQASRRKDGWPFFFGGTKNNSVHPIFFLNRRSLLTERRNVLKRYLLNLQIRQWPGQRRTLHKHSDWWLFMVFALSVLVVCFCFQTKLTKKSINSRST